MRKFLSVLALAVFATSASYASFPVSNEAVVTSEKQTVVSTEASAKMEKRAAKAQERFTKKIEKIESKVEKAKAKGDDSTVAIILALVSVLFLPFGLHNWYLGRKNQALWQTLLVFPFGILLVPALISWIWQIVDLIRLLINGELPQK